MSFLNPLFLIALLAAAIPLLIYLLNVRKPEKVLFSTLTFFDKLKQSALKRIRIKRFLLLAVRMLAILMLVIASARPFLPAGAGTTREGEPKAVVILIDNSPSMQQVDQNGPYIDQALVLADELIEMMDDDDRILLSVTNGEPLSAPFVSPGGARSGLPGIGVSNKGIYTYDRIEAAVRRLRQAPEPNKYIYFITDAQATHLERVAEEGSIEDADYELQVILTGSAEPSNTGIESAELEMQAEEGAEDIRLRTRVKNYGEIRVQNQFLNFIVDGELLSQQPLALAPGAAGEFQFRVPISGRSNIPVELRIEGDELTFDDRYYLGIQLPDVRNIAVITEQSGRSATGLQSYLLPMFEVMDAEMDRFQFTFYTVSDFQAGEIGNYDAVVLDGVKSIPDYLSESLIEMIQAGGGVLLMPAADGDISDYNRLLGAGNSASYSDLRGSYGSFDVIDRMAVPTEGHPVIDEIFDKPEDEEVRLNVPEIFYYFQIEQGGIGDSYTILSTRTGGALVQENRMGNGRIVFSAIGSDPGWSNFPVKPFFAPFFFRTVDYLARGEGPTLNNHSLGKPFSAVIPGTVDDVTFKKDGEQFNAEKRQLFDGSEFHYDGVEWSPGWVTVTSEGMERLYSVNQHAMESVLNSLNIAEVEELMGTVIGNVNATRAGSDTDSLFSELETASFGKEIWFWFIIAAIILLMTESMISRLYTVETMGDK